MFEMVMILLVALLALFVVISIPALRLKLLSSPMLKLLSKMRILPHISDTEKSAIEAGKVGPELEFFTGNPNFEILRSIKPHMLTQEEVDFIYNKDGPVEQLCQMTNDHKAWENSDFSEEIWNYMKEQKFFGMIIPKEYGGLGFSHYAHGMVIQKLSSRSAPLSVTVMVPNSLGPAELLLNYGTETQRNYYLPRLADGREIPCFGLTEPEAGSDATSIQSSGVLFRDNDQIRIKLNWQKRWITLNTKSTLIGIAFRLKDPDHLLGTKEDLGITIALVPSDRDGINQSERHDPLMAPFINGPLWGKDVVIDVNDIVGGQDYIGKGWLMITECLSAGRGISLPSHYTGSSKMVCATVSAHANLRHQFGMPIGKFEGVGAPLAQMYAYTYLMEATNKQVLNFMEHYGIIPVVSAIAKYNITELGRKVINHAMDIAGGTGISRGPQNRLANFYISTPIGITVEGANILTRTLIIFGQGALRSHPYSYPMMNAILQNDLKQFDRAFWGFSRHAFTNYFRSSWHSLTRAYFSSPNAPSRIRRHYQKLVWTSCKFAFLTDLVMIFYGGKLKRNEHLTGRFADLLSWQVMGFSALSHFENNRYPDHQKDVFEFAMQEVFNNIQMAMEQIYRNLRIPLIGLWYKTIGLKLLQLNPIGKPQSDKLTNKTSHAALTNIKLRNELLKEIFVPSHRDDPTFNLENAFSSYIDCLPALDKIKKAQSKKKLPAHLDNFHLYHQAFTKDIISQREFEKLRYAEKERLLALTVHSGHKKGVQLRKPQVA